MAVFSKVLKSFRTREKPDGSSGSNDTSSNSSRYLFSVEVFSFWQTNWDTNKILSGCIKIRTFTHTQVEKSKR